MPRAGRAASGGDLAPQPPLSTRHQPEFVRNFPQKNTFISTFLDLSLCTRGLRTYENTSSEPSTVHRNISLIRVCVHTVAAPYSLDHHDSLNLNVIRTRIVIKLFNKHVCIYHVVPVCPCGCTVDE